MQTYDCRTLLYVIPNTLFSNALQLKADTARRVYLDFDGVMAFPKVYVNGQLAGALLDRLKHAKKKTRQEKRRR